MDPKFLWLTDIKNIPIYNTYMLSGLHTKNQYIYFTGLALLSQSYLTLSDDGGYAKPSGLFRVKSTVAFILAWPVVHDALVAFSANIITVCAVLIRFIFNTL